MTFTLALWCYFSYTQSPDRLIKQFCAQCVSPSLTIPRTSIPNPRGTEKLALPSSFLGTTTHGLRLTSQKDHSCLAGMFQPKTDFPFQMYWATRRSQSGPSFIHAEVSRGKEQTPQRCPHKATTQYLPLWASSLDTMLCHLMGQRSSVSHWSFCPPIWSPPQSKRHIYPFQVLVPPGSVLLVVISLPRPCQDRTMRAGIKPFIQLIQ